MHPHENHTRLLFTHKNGEIGAISVTKRSSARRPRKWSDRYLIGFVPQSGVVWEGIWSVAEVNNSERGIEITETEVNTLLVPNFSGTWIWRGLIFEGLWFQDLCTIAKSQNFTNIAFSPTWPESMQIYWNKRNRLHKKRVQLPQDWLGTLTWPPFHWFGTSIWPPWRHVKTLYKVFRIEDCDLDAERTRPSRPTAPLRCSMCVTDLFQFCAVAVQAILDSFSCWHEKLSYAHICQLNIPDFSKIGVTMETYCLTRK